MGDEMKNNINPTPPNNSQTPRPLVSAEEIARAVAKAQELGRGESGIKEKQNTQASPNKTGLEETELEIEAPKEAVEKKEELEIRNVRIGQDKNVEVQAKTSAWASGAQAKPETPVQTRSVPAAPQIPITLPSASQPLKAVEKEFGVGGTPIAPVDEHVTVIPEDIKEVAKQEKDFLPPIRGAVSPKDNATEGERLKGEEKREHEEKPESRPSIIRTFKGDIAGAVRNQSMSLAGIAIKEDEKRREEAAVATHTSRVNTLLVVTSLVFVCAGLLLIGYLKFFHKNTSTPAATTAPALQTFVFADEHEDVDLTDTTFRQAREKLFAELLGPRLRVGTIKSLSFINTSDVQNTAGKTTQQRYYIGASEFFDRFGVTAPESFTRQLDPQFMYGLYSFKGQSGFLIIKTSDYASLFAELLAYEDRLPRDLYPLFTGTSSPEVGSHTFTVEVINNIDTRTLRDEFGNLVMLWSFMGTRDKVIITANEDIFREVVNRLQTPSKAQ